MPSTEMPKDADKKKGRAIIEEAATADGIDLPAVP
jgi:hypothetical protein